MHNSLENYLHEVERHLASLPALVRESEVRETRDHLQQLTADFRSQGLDESDASTRAMTRFGSARSVGLRLRDVWERNRGPLPVAFVVVLANWVFYSFNFTLLVRTLFGLAFRSQAMLEAMSPAFTAWTTATVFFFPFALNFALGFWGGRRVAPAVVAAYLPLLWLSFMRLGGFMSVFTGVIQIQNVRVGAVLTSLLIIFTAFLGARCGAARQRQRRFALIGDAASAEEAAAVLARPRRVRVRFLPVAAWLLGIGAFGGASFLLLQRRADDVLRPKTPEAAVRVWLSDAGSNWNEMKPATNVSTRLLPAASAREKAGIERRVWYQATMHATDEYRLQRIAYLQKQLRLGKKNPYVVYEAKYARASLARLKPEGYTLQRVVRVRKTPNGWRVVHSLNSAELPHAWLYDVFYEGPK